MHQQGSRLLAIQNAVGAPETETASENLLNPGTPMRGTVRRLQHELQGDGAADHP